MLSQKECVPCKDGVKPLSAAAAKKLLLEVPGWDLGLDGKALRRRFKFKDFKSAMKFAGKIGDIAEEQGHHPDLMVGWGYVECVVLTHAIHGLHENDFILASKINALQGAM